MALVTLLTVGGCQEIVSQDDGTTKGFYRCKEEGKKQGLQDHTVELFCVAKHERSLVSKTSGEAVAGRRYNYDTREMGAYYFSGGVVNDSADSIITSFTIVFHRDKDGTHVSKTFPNRWGEPGNRVYFEISEKDLPMTEEDTKAPLQWYWSVYDIRGIKIKI